MALFTYFQLLTFNHPPNPAPFHLISPQPRVIPHIPPNSAIAFHLPPPAPPDTANHGSKPSLKGRKQGLQRRKHLFSKSQYPGFASKAVTHARSQECYRFIDWAPASPFAFSPSPLAFQNPRHHYLKRISCLNRKIQKSARLPLNPARPADPGFSLFDLLPLARTALICRLIAKRSPPAACIAVSGSDTPSWPHRPVPMQSPHTALMRFLTGGALSRTVET